VLLSSSFQVQGKASGTAPKTENLVCFLQNRRFELSKVNSDSDTEGVELLFRAADENGKVLALRPVMGAFAHMVAFDPELRGFAHLHPLENILPADASDSHQGALTFSFNPPKNGFYRLWAQVRIGEEAETFIPFDLKVGS
jgi:hypothetical protein